MTRINANIKIQTLCDAHLLAEHREITRIPNVVKSGKANLDNIPQKFSLNKGHVSFFYDKLFFLRHRYWNLYVECRKRGFNVMQKLDCWDGIPEHLMNDWTATEEDNNIVLERITERLSGMKNKKHTSYV